MQKIDKSKILSTQYKIWLENLKDKEHPKYNSSKGIYYHDIKMSLLYCQNGLCAYSEKLLCNPKFIDIKNWDSNKFIKKLEQSEKDSIKGDLEHFDESLKPQKAWLWDNLFIVDTHINCRIKRSKPIKSILKPDSQDYDPYKYLSFDFETGVFTPNIKLRDKKKEKDIEDMILTLGINCYSNERKLVLKSFQDRKDVGLPVKPYEYPTAWEMMQA